MNLSNLIKYNASDPLPALNEVSITYIWWFDIAGAAAGLAHIQLQEVLEELSQDFSEIYESQYAPIASFLDDVTLKKEGRGGRPLLLALRAEGAPVSASVSGFSKITYTAEGRNVEVHQRGSDTRELKIVDAIALFENGMAAYLMTVMPCVETQESIGFYDLLHLQNSTSNSDALSWSSEHINAASLNEFAQSNIDRIFSEKGDGVLSPVFRRSQMSSLIDRKNIILSDSCTGLVAVDNAEWLDRLKGARSSISQFGEIREPQPGDDHWVDQSSPVLTDALAFSGILQGILDFPFQGKNEISDALCPLFEKEGLYYYHNNNGLIGLSCEWRSFREMRGLLGSCPYFLITALVSGFNQQLVERFEQQISHLIVESELIVASPLSGLREMMRDTVRQFFAGPSKSLRQLMESRLMIYEGILAQEICNIFRYEEERQLLKNLDNRLALRARLSQCKELLDRFDVLLKDVLEAGASASARRINLLLFVLALLGVVGVVADGIDILKLNIDPNSSLVLLLVSLGALLFTTRALVESDARLWSKSKRRKALERRIYRINSASKKK